MFSGRAILRYLGIFLMLALTTCLYAQLNHGDMEGTATDPQGAVIPGVDVAITSVDRNVSQTTKTNSAGYYRVVDLVPGKYRVHFEASGFSPLDVTEIEVRAGELIKVDASLKLGGAKQSVQVTAEVCLCSKPRPRISPPVSILAPFGKSLWRVGTSSNWSFWRRESTRWVGRQEAISASTASLDRFRTQPTLWALTFQ